MSHTSSDLVEIIPYSEKVEATKQHYMRLVAEQLPDAEIIPIGSYAVPMIGKKEIDLMVLVNDVAAAQERLVDVGFNKGPTIDGQAYSRNHSEWLIGELHIMRPENNKVKYYQGHVERLQKNPEIRAAYERLKLSLDGVRMKAYRAAKKEFINEYLS